MPTIEFEMWDTPILAAGEIGKNSVAIKEFPIPIIGSKKKPYIPIAILINRTLPETSPPTIIKNPGIPEATIMIYYNLNLLYLSSIIACMTDPVKPNIIKQPPNALVALLSKSKPIAKGPTVAARVD